MQSTPIGRALRALADGQNVSETLSGEGLLPLSDAELIEVMYEVQAGSYTHACQRPDPRRDAFIAEIAHIVGDVVDPDSSLLDVGTGESTSLIPVLEATGHRGAVRAVDISWSRLTWAQENAAEVGRGIDFAVADIARIPLPDDSVDFVLSTHALEPNGGREAALLTELARVARRGMVLIEPDWDNASAEQRERMNRLGYIESIPRAARDAGLTEPRVIPFRHSLNPLNSSAAFVFVNLQQAPSRPHPSGAWVDPVEHESLSPFGGGLRTGSGRWFPCLAGIPFLRPSDALLAAKPAPQVESRLAPDSES